VKDLSPVTGWKGSLKQQGAHDIIGGTNHALDLAVMWESVGTRHPELEAVREEESAGGGVIKLVSIITLDALDGAAKLRGHKGEEVREGGQGHCPIQVHVCSHHQSHVCPQKSI
jgi:hypothetical protein